ncbi:uncharacterized protein LOC130818702 [Amaranthus tricolor]|uniref:uncharacterized protein LOC130818702 n=1 Tax=Amaranthus tricolor TaxID=29722 RepID=UPI00258C7739|nr:uncharacterized protein LOC130818702 [Amaranthus tricolor]
MGPCDDDNESNELVDDPSEDDVDVDVDEDALANDMTLDEYMEDKSWRTWACDTTYTEEGENVEYRTETSNQTVLTLKCKRGCSWRLRARLDAYSSSWHIVTYKHGSCVLGSDTVSAGHIHLTSFVINNVIRNCVAKDPSIKQQALLSIYGTWEGSYSLLLRFLKALQHSNAGLVVEWFFKVDNDAGVYVRPNIRTFQRVFWAFKPCIEGFNHYKPLIAIDDIYLYGKYRHKGIFPLAFASVEKKCIGAWSWFMACIRKHVTQRMSLCVVSDRHAGNIATMEELGWQPPYAHHRFWLRHLLSNFKRVMGNVQRKKLFGRTAEQR